MSLVLLDGDDETGTASSNPDFIIPVKSRRRYGFRPRHGASWSAVPAQVAAANPAIIFRYGSRARHGVVPRRGHYWIPTTNQVAPTVVASIIPIRQSHRIYAPPRRRARQSFPFHVSQTFTSPLIVTITLGVSGAVSVKLSTAANVSLVLDTAARVTIDLTSLNYEP